MFWKKDNKTAEEIIQYLDNAFSKNSEDIGKLEKRLEEKIEENQKLLRRQAGSVEDVLEELQSQESEAGALSQKLEEMEEHEGMLMELSISLLSQREMILQQLLAEGVLEEEAREGWRKQAQIMEQETAILERKCTLMRLGICGEKVDYNSHEILAVYDTEEGQQSGTVAQVFASGYCYNGNIIKKAQVAVYRAGENV